MDQSNFNNPMTTSKDVENEIQKYKKQGSYSDKQVDQYKQFLQVYHSQHKVEHAISPRLKDLQSEQSEDPTKFMNYLTTSNHPVTCLFHIGFKTVVLIVYLFMSMIFSKFMIAEIILICSTLDFWFVKNVSGRLLVGLRWWSEIDNDENDRWVFECMINENLNNPFNQKLFWNSQSLFSFIWLLFSFINIISFQGSNFVLTAFNFITCFVNLWAFYKCSKVQREKIKFYIESEGQSYISNFIDKQMKFAMNK